MFDRVCDAFVHFVPGQTEFEVVSHVMIDGKEEKVVFPISSNNASSLMYGDPRVLNDILDCARGQVAKRENGGK